MAHEKEKETVCAIGNLKRTRTDGWYGRSKRKKKSLAEQEISILIFFYLIRISIQITRDRRYLIGLGFLSLS
jgi:hypothetical protein